MPEHTQADARCRVFTYKEGLLSAVAHDLELDVGDFRLAWDDARTRLTLTARAASVRVLHAMRDGRPDPSALAPRDLRKIEATVSDEVLHAARHPEILFEAERVAPDNGGFVVTGTLALHGRRRTVVATVHREGGRWIGETQLHQPDFGITPYSAMLGTLRIRPDVRVRVEAPA